MQKYPPATMIPIGSRRDEGISVDEGRQLSAYDDRCLHSEHPGRSRGDLSRRPGQHPRAQATIMPDRAPDHRAIGHVQFAVPIQGTDGRRDQVVICKCRTSTNKRVSSNHAHL